MLDRALRPSRSRRKTRGRFQVLLHSRLLFGSPDRTGSHKTSENSLTITKAVRNCTALTEIVRAGYHVLGAIMTFRDSDTRGRPSMTSLISKRKYLFAVVAVIICLAAVGIIAYAAHLRASATALVASARAIRSTADAEREIASWRKRAGQRFWQESDHPGGDHNYDGQIDNVLIARLGVVKPTAVTLGLTMRKGELRCVTVIMSTGWYPSTGASVWVQEWFDSNSPRQFHISAKNRPWGAAVDFPASAPLGQREKAFALNTRCFVQPRACKTAQDILPTIWQLEAPLSGYLSSNSSDLLRMHVGPDSP